MVKRIRPIKRFARGIADPKLAEAIDQIEERINDAIKHEHDPAAVGAVSTAYTINTTAPLTGGGTLTAVSRTFAITPFSGGAPGSVPTSPGGATTFLRADGTWNLPTSSLNIPGFLSAYFGHGSDGAAVFSGAAGVTGFTQVGSVYTATRETFFTTAIVSSGVEVETAGYPISGTRTLTNNGRITHNGKSTTSGAGGLGAPIGYLGVLSSGGNASSGLGGPVTTSPPWCGFSIANNGGAINTPGDIGNIPGRGGGGGGDPGGVGGSGGAMNTSGVTPELFGGDMYHSTRIGRALGNTATRWASATGGGAAASRGGGGAGGYMIINFSTIAGTGSFECAGGNGASETNPANPNNGGGGGGGGGFIQLTYLTKTGGGCSVTGGTGGSGQGSGGSGGGGATGVVRYYNLTGDGT